MKTTGVPAIPKEDKGKKKQCSYFVLKRILLKLKSSVEHCHKNSRFDFHALKLNEVARGTSTLCCYSVNDGSKIDVDRHVFQVL